MQRVTSLIYMRGRSKRCHLIWCDVWFPSMTITSSKEYYVRSKQACEHTPDAIVPRPTRMASTSRVHTCSHTNRRGAGSECAPLSHQPHQLRAGAVHLAILGNDSMPRFSLPNCKRRRERLQAFWQQCCRHSGNNVKARQGHRGN